MGRDLTNDELLELRAFSRQFDRIRKSRLLQDKKLRTSFSTNFNFTSGEVTTTFTGYDEDLFQAQLPIFRQFVLNDPVNFHHIHNLINQCCDRHELLAWTRYARQEWHERLAWLPGEVHQHLHHVTDSVEDALNKLFYGYGGLFHVDLNAPDEEESAQAIQNGLLHRAFPYLCRCLNILDSVIHWWLDAPNETVTEFPAQEDSKE